MYKYLFYAAENMISRIDIGKKIHAVTPVVSATLVLFVVTFTIGSVVFWGVPFVDEIHSRELLENAEMQFNAVLDDIDELVYDGHDSKEVTPFAADDGFISIDKNEYDRSVVIYSITSDEEYNFTVDWSEDNSWFRLNMTGAVTKAIVYWLDYTGEISYHETLYPDELRFDAPRDHPFSGIVNISLYSGDEHFGNIWVFDSNHLTYTFNYNGMRQKLILEKGGLVYSNSKNIWVKRPFSFYAEEDAFNIGVVQITASASSTAGGNGLRVRINSNSYGSYVREKKHVYYIKLQFYGVNAPAWLAYFVGRYDFAEFSYNTLFYKPSDPDIFSGGVFLLFSHSVIEFRIY